MLRMIILLFSVLVVIVCFEGKKREGRLFSFNFEDRDVNVDLDISIPFLTIPIKSASESFASSGLLPTININPAALALGGAVVLGTTVLLPLIMKSYASHSGYKRYSKLLENTDFSSETMISFANQMLTDGRGLRECALRVVCWTEQEHYADSSKIMTYIVNNKLLSTILNTTAVNDAVLSGRNGQNCDRYSPCPIQKRHMPVLIENLAGVNKYFGRVNS